MNKLLLTLCLNVLVYTGFGQTLFDSFSDGNFSSSPAWSGTANWTIATSSDAAAGATNSNTLRLNASTTGTDYLSAAQTGWGNSQEWGVFIGRRAQGFTAANQSYVWLFANESTLTSGTVDGYRIAIGDDSGNDEVRLEYIVDGAVSATVITSTGAITNGLTDIGFLVRVTRSATGVWTLYTSTLPSSNGAGAIASDIPNSTNANVSQGSATHTSVTPTGTGYIGVVAVHSSSASAIVAQEFDQFYFTVPLASEINASVGGEPTSISSLVNSAGAASSNFNFYVKDDSIGNDALPTLITQIVINQGTGNDISDWTQIIAGAILYDGTSSSSATVGATSLTFSSIATAPGTLGYIGDDQRKEYQIRIYLKTALGGTLPTTVDGLNLAFKVTAANVTVSGSGSSPFSSATGAIESGSTNNAVAVVATALNYTQAFAPTTIDPNISFPTPGIVRAQDANGNTDLDYSSAVTISNTGSLGMTGTPTAFASGVLSFASFKFTTGGATVTVGVDDGNAGTTNATSGSITVNNPPTSDVSSAVGGEAVSVSSIANTSGAAVSVFNFTVTDDASGNDALNTLISQIVISQGTGNDVATWTNVIAGATLSDGTNTLAGTVNGTNITFASIPNGAGQLGEVVDGGSKTYTLNLWINVVIGGGLASTVDGMNLAFKVDRSSFTASVSGTPFAPGAGTAVESGATNNAVDVTATALNFTTAFAPTTRDVFTNFTTPGTVKAQDANGNLDLGYSSLVTITNSAGYSVINTPSAFTSGTLAFPANFQFVTGGSTTTITVDDGNAGTTNATSAVLTITVPTPTLATSVLIKNFLCPGGSVSVPYTATNFGTGNVFTAQLSDASGSFASPVNIGSLTSQTSGTISATIPANTANGTGYRIRVVGNTPAYTGTDNGLDITIQFSTTTAVFTESMGTVSGTTTILAQETANGFDNDSYTMSGTADLRATSSSSGYSGASGGANVFFSTSVSNAAFEIAGINTLGLSPMVLTFGLSNDAATSGTDFILEVSTDGTTYNSIPWGTVPTSVAWRKITVVASVPQVSNLRLRFRRSSNVNAYRLDDVTLSYGTATTPGVSPAGPVTQCGGTVNITATPAGGSYLWSNTATTQSISAGSTGNYSVTITDGFGCSVTKGPVSVTISTPAVPTISISSATTPICAGASNSFSVASSTNGGSTPTYQWKVNGVGVGGGTSYSSSSLAAGDLVTCEMTSSLSCVSPTTIASNPLSVQGFVSGGLTQLFTENFGNSGSNIAIASYTSSTNPSLAFSGSVSTVRNSTASTNYPGATGGGNIFLPGNAGNEVIISNINTTTAYPNILTYGVYKSTNSENGSSLSVSYSVDGITYVALPSPKLKSGTLTSDWCDTLITYNNYLPAATNLRLRFINSVVGSNDFRVDDITIKGYTPSSANVTAGGPTSFCPGGSVTLTASPSGLTYAWSNSASTISTTVNSASTYTVTVTDILGCNSTANKVVTVNAVPTVNPTAVSGTICNGGGTTINANATAGSGTISSYNWSAGLGNVASGTVNPITTTAYTVTVTNSNGCTASGSVTVTVNNCGVNTWLGNTTDWHTATNWSNGYVPNSCAHDVLIPSVANSPVISSPVSVGNIELQSNALLTLNAGVSVCGDYVGGSGNVSKVLGSGTFTLSGSGSQALSGKTLFNTLRLNNSTGAVLQSGAQFDVFTAVELQSGTLNTTAGTLRFRSTSSSDYAVLDNFSAGFTGTINGNVTAERYYDAAGSGAKNQHLMGSPIAATPLSAFGASGTPGYIIPTGTCDEINSASNSPWGTVFSYDESHGATCAQAGWKVETGGTATAAKGFSVYKTGAGVITVSGAPNLAGSYQATALTNTGGWQNFTQQGRSVDAGWHMVANPYLSDLDISSTPSGFDPLKMVWNTTGAFAGSYQPATVVGPFQAFMVRKSVPGSATYTINASQRTRSGSPVFQKQTNDHELTITATNTGTNLMDVTTVAFNADASAGFDAGYDAVKSAGALTRHTLYTTMNGSPSWLCLNVVKDIETTNSIPLNMEPGVNGTYSLSFNGVSSFDPTSYITLEDKQLNVFHDVRSGAYSFTANANDNWNRFVLHFTPAAKFSSSNATCQAQGQLNITQPGSANWNYTITNSANVTIASGVLNNSQPVISSVAAGVYTITLVDNNGYTVVKNIQVNGATPITAAMQASSTVAEAGEDITFTSTTANAASTTWNFGDGSAEQTATISTHQYATEGVYTVSLTATNTNGCSSTVLQSVTVTAKTATGIETVENNGLRMWSNGDRVYVDFSNLKQVEATIDIYNILGQKLSSEKFGKSSIYSHAFTNLDAGYVLLSVKNNGEVVTRKLFISTSK